MIQVFLAMKMGIEFRRRQIHVPSLSNCDVLKDAKGRLGGGGGGGRRKKYQGLCRPKRSLAPIMSDKEKFILLTRISLSEILQINPGLLLMVMTDLRLGTRVTLKSPIIQFIPKAVI